MAGPGGAKKPVLEIDKLYTVDPSILIGLGRENDRKFILKLEEEIVKTLASPSDTLQVSTAIDSYHRMLVHRIGDFYGMERRVNVQNKLTNQQSTKQMISLHRTEHSRIHEQTLVIIAAELDRQKAATASVASDGADCGSQAGQVKPQAPAAPASAPTIMQRSAAQARPEPPLHESHLKPAKPVVLQRPGGDAAQGAPAPKVQFAPQPTPELAEEVVEQRKAPPAGFKLMKREKPVEKSAEDAAREAAERKAAVPEQSLEDRQKQYQQARARIFGSDEDHDFSDPVEEVAGATTVKPVKGKKGYDPDYDRRAFMQPTAMPEI